MLTQRIRGSLVIDGLPAARDVRALRGSAAAYVARCAAAVGVLAALAALALAAPAQGALYGAQPATGDIVTVDPATGAVTDSFDAPDDLEAGDTLVGLSGAEKGSMLIYRNDPNSDVNTLFRINPATGAALSIESADENPTDGLSFQTGPDLTRFIFSSHSGSDIHRQTGFSGFDSGNWAGGDPVGGLGGDDFGREFGFFIDGGSTLREYDPFMDTDAFKNTLPAPAQDIQGLAFDGTNLYASTASGTLYTLNPDTGQVLNTATVAGGALYGLGVADPSKAPAPRAQGALYGAQPATGDIVTVDPATGAVTDSFDAPDDLEAGDTLVGLTGAEEGATLIYRNDPNSDVNTLFRINPLTGAALSIESSDENPTDGLSFQTGPDLTQFIFSSHSGTDIHRQTGFSGGDSGNHANGDPVGGLGGDDFGREFGFFIDGGATLREYDPFMDTDAFKNTMPAPAQDIQGLAFDGTNLYASTASGTLYTVNPNTGAVLNTVTVAGGALYGLGVAQAPAAAETDLAVVKQCVPATAAPGAEVQCTVTVTNNGSVPAHDVVLIDALAEGPTASSVSSTAGLSCTRTSDAEISCNVTGPLAPGDSESLMTTITLPADAGPDAGVREHRHGLLEHARREHRRQHRYRADRHAGSARSTCAAPPRDRWFAAPAATTSSAAPNNPTRFAEEAATTSSTASAALTPSTAKVATTRCSAAPATTRSTATTATTRSGAQTATTRSEAQTATTR